jgi:hypothetical protein
VAVDGHQVVFAGAAAFGDEDLLLGHRVRARGDVEDGAGDVQLAAGGGAHVGEAAGAGVEGG